jgi:hypothetical protein
MEIIYKVQGSWFLVSGSLFLVQGSMFKVQCSWFLVNGSLFLVGLTSKSSASELDGISYLIVHLSL